MGYHDDRLILAAAGAVLAAFLWPFCARALQHHIIWPAVLDTIIVVAAAIGFFSYGWRK